MDHTFRSARDDIARLSEALSCISTILAVDAASPDDLAHIANREDALVEDAALRECVTRHSSKLGLLVRTAESAAVQHGACVQNDLVGPHDGAWRDRLRGTRAEAAFAADRVDVLQRIASELRTARDALAQREGEDGGSSSPSDYSDSETRSSSEEEMEDEEEGEDEDEGEDEEDESEDEEEEERTAPLPRRRRR